MAIVDLMLGFLELLYVALWEFVPAVCYLTAVILVPVATFGKISIQYPRNPAKPRWHWQNSIGRRLQGKTILSPSFGTIIGLALWYFAGMLAVLLYPYLPSPA